MKVDTSTRHQCSTIISVLYTAWCRRGVGNYNNSGDENSHETTLMFTEKIAVNYSYALNILYKEF